MSEKVKALGMVLEVMARQKEGKGPRVATCPSCDEPLVMTLKFPGKEFVCVECGRLWGFVDPIPKEETPELLARMAELKAKWDAEQEKEA